MVKRFDVFLVNLDAEVTDDPKNTRPAVIVSPDELNDNLSTAIIAPLSATKAAYPTRVPVVFLNGKRFIILDQIRTVDKDRLVKKIGEIDPGSRRETLETLAEIFAE